MFGQLGSFAKNDRDEDQPSGCLSRLPGADCGRPECVLSDLQASGVRASHRNAAVQRGEYHTFDVSYDVDEMKMEMDVGINNYTKKSFFSRCNFARITPNDRCVFFFVAFCVDSSVA